MFFFNARLLGAEKGISHRDQANVMMPSQPLTAFVMVQPEFLFLFPAILFNPPARFGHADQAAQPERLRAKLGQPVLGRLLLTPRPLYQQPLRHPRRMLLFPPSMRR